MHAHQIMSRRVITIDPDAPIVDAINTMLAHHVSGLPVVDRSNRLVGMVSETDFLRRTELGTGRRRGRLLTLLTGADRLALEFMREHGRKVADIMTRNPVTITEDTPLEEVARLMESHDIKRLPVMRGNRLIGMLTRSDFLPAIANLWQNLEGYSESDEAIRAAVFAALAEAPWRPCGLNVSVRDGVVSLRGTVRSANARQAAIVAAESVGGAKRVDDQLEDRADDPPPEEDYGGGDFVSLAEEPSTVDDQPL